MLYRTKTRSVPAYGPLYATRGIHMYAVCATSNRINKECTKACAAIVNINGHIINEERKLLTDGYIKVTFTYEIV